MDKNLRKNKNIQHKNNRESSLYKDIHSVDVIKDYNDNIPLINLSESDNNLIDDDNINNINIISFNVKKDDKNDQINDLDSNEYDYQNSNVNKRNRSFILSNTNQKSKFPVSISKFNINNLKENKNKNENSFSQSFNKLVRFTTYSLEKINNKFIDMESKYKKLSKDVKNIKRCKEPHNSHEKFRLKSIKDNIDNNVINSNLQHARVEQKIFTEKDFKILDSDEQINQDDIKLDVEDEEKKDDGLHFTLNYKIEKNIDVNIRKLDRYIKTYEHKKNNYELALFSVDLFATKCELDKIYCLTDLPSSSRNLLERFNSLVLYDENEILNKKRYSIVNLILRYQPLIEQIINNNHKFYKIIINDKNLNENNFFSNYSIYYPDITKRPTLLSKFFEKHHEFTGKDLLEYDKHKDYVSIEVDKLMFILGVDVFYSNSLGKRNNINHYCVKCNDFTNDYYIARHVNQVHNNDHVKSLTLEESLSKLGKVCTTNAQEDNILLKCFQRSYAIYSLTNAELFKKKLIQDAYKNKKIVNEFKKLLIKFVLLSGCLYDDMMFEMINIINSLSVNDVVTYYLYILTNINAIHV